MSGPDDYGKAVILLFELADAARARAARSPHAAPALHRMAHSFEVKAYQLRPADHDEIGRVNTEMPERLAFLRGPMTPRE